MSDQATERKKRKQRSPSYPGIGLEAAIERARILHEQEGRNPAPINAVLQHWGYSSKSGAGMVAVAALKKFGLLVDEGRGTDRKARVSNLGRAIILDGREDSPERDDAIRRAALSPDIHRELWNKYSGTLPSDATLRHFLRFEKGFTDSAADELIAQFRETVSFAQLSPSDTVSDGDSDAENAELDDGNGGEVTTLVHEGRGERGGQTRQRSVQLPLSATEWVTVQAAFPLTEAAWSQMLRVLDAMKPGLVAPAPPSSDE